MFCDQCGTKVQNEDKFCPNCGAPLQNAPSTGEMTNSQQTGNDQVFAPQSNMEDVAKKIGETAQKAGAMAQQGLQSGQQFAKEKIVPKLSKKMIIPAVAIVIALLVAIILISSHKYTINLDDYVNVTFEGYNGYGSAQVDYDLKALQLEIYKNAKIKGLNGKAKKQLKEMNSVDDVMSLIFNSDLIELSKFIYMVEEQSPRYDLEASETLSNGDEVVVTFDYDNELYKDYGIKFASSEQKFTAKDLTEATTYDYFSNIDVSFAGIAPNVYVEISDNNTDVRSYVSYSLSKQEGIQKGETITITLQVDDDNLMEDYGYVISEKTKEYTCESVAEYVSQLSQIPEDMMQKMQKQAEDAFNAYVAKDWADEAVLKKQTFIGNYLLTPKQGMSTDANNYIYLIYEIKAKNPDAGNFTYYYYTCFTDALLLDDGTCSIDISNYSVPQGGWFSSESFEKGNLTYSGYETLDSLFSACVTSKIENYEYESTVQE